ncbi:MAG: hypothetical protein FWF96_02815, partial [Kiritimatiellaeota bacterium]|nr:hypothetical protein [Kiritimatiellota bacterium]
MTLVVLTLAALLVRQCMMKKGSRVNNIVCTLAVLAFWVMASVKELGDFLSSPHNDPSQQVESGETREDGGPQSSPPAPLPLPQWYADLNLPTNGWDGVANIPVYWRQRTHCDSPLPDNQLDRDSDGLTDFEEFILGTDPRAFSTSGGIIGDGWLAMRGLDPLEVWDDFVTNGVPMRELYLNGWEPVDDGTDYGAWLARGLEYGVDDWPEEDDEDGDITLVSVHVTGAASGHAVVSIGPARHIGGKPKIYAFRSGRRYPVTVRGLHGGGAGLAGRVVITPVVGMSSHAEGFNEDFVLSSGGGSQSQGGGMMLMNAPANGEEELGVKDTWKLAVLPANVGCLLGRLGMNVRGIKEGAGYSY